MSPLRTYQQKAFRKITIAWCGYPPTTGITSSDVMAQHHIMITLARFGKTKAWLSQIKELMLYEKVRLVGNELLNFCSFQLLH